MSARVVITPRVRDFVRTLPPEPKAQLRAALRDLAAGRGDIKPLEGALEGIYRLRVGRYRVAYRVVGGQLRCFFAAPRPVVYEFLAAHLRELINE